MRQVQPNKLFEIIGRLHVENQLFAEDHEVMKELLRAKEEKEAKNSKNNEEIKNG